MKAYSAIGLGIKSAKTPSILWTPDQIISSIGAWYDPSDTSTVLHVANAVYQLNDKSENGLHLVQGTGANQPTTNTRTINGLNTLDFDGTNDTMANTGAFWNANFSGTNKPYEVFIAMESDESASAGYSFAITQASFNSLIGLYRTATNNTTGAVRRDNANVQQLPVVNLPTTELGSYSTSFDGSFITTRGNGTLISTSIASILTAMTVNQLHLGSFRSAGLYFNGKYGESLFFVTPLSTANREKLEGYLAWKWGTVSSLGAGHPYKNFAPRAID